MERLRADIGANWDTYAFVADHLRASGGGRGAKTAAFEAAAKRFEIDVKTAARRWRRIDEAMTPQTMLSLAFDVTRDMKASATQALENLRLIELAFNEREQRELQMSSAPFVAKLAAERLELIELRKQLKGKRK